MICTVPDCGKNVRCKGLCSVHYDRNRKYGRLTVTRRASGTFTVRPDGRVMVTRDGKQIFEHVYIAEQAIGHRLPKRAPVHHVDYNQGNNSNANLVVCPSYKYHQLLHVRTNALNACGNANWRKCRLCKEYDATENLKRIGKSECFIHTQCQLTYFKNWKDKKRQGVVQ